MATCPCGYNNATNIARHKRTCKIAKSHDCEQREYGKLTHQLLEMSEHNAELTRQVLEIKQQNLEMRARNDRLAQECEELRSRPVVVNNYNSTNSVSVNILAYGQEPLPDTQDVLNILLPPEHSVARYMALKHFRDPKHSNIRINNKRSKTMQVVETDVNNHLRWTEKNKKETIEKIVDNNLDELTETHGATRIDRWKQWYKSSGLEDPAYDRTDAFMRIHRDVENMLLSQKNMPL